MNRMLRPRLLVGFSVSAALIIAAPSPSLAQEIKPTQRSAQVAGVDNTRMGAYRALAQLSYAAFQKGDIATAAELARILERTWDAAEEQGGDRSLVKTNKDLFAQLDKAMDGFIGPILSYNPVPPDAAALSKSYQDLVPQLKSENMESYRGFAASTYEAFQRGDLANAKTLATNLLREWRTGAGDLKKSSPNTWATVNETIRSFAVPLARFQPNPPDSAAVRSAYDAFVESLRKAD